MKESVAERVGIGHDCRFDTIINDRQTGGAADFDMLRGHGPIGQGIDIGERAIDPDSVGPVHADSKAKQNVPGILQRRLQLAFIAINDEGDRARRQDPNQHAVNKGIAWGMRQGAIFRRLQPQLAEQFADRLQARRNRLPSSAMFNADLDAASLEVPLRDGARKKNQRECQRARCS